MMRYALPAALVLCCFAATEAMAGKKNKEKGSGNTTTSTTGDKTTPFQTAITEKTLPDGLKLEEVDLNSDKRADIFNYYRERANAPRLLVRKDTDLDMNGKVDIRSWYDDYGKLELEEMDLDFDGQFDMKDHYEDTDGDGKPERVQSELDTDFDGTPNVFTNYLNGKPVRKERDTNGDGRIDMWEKFDDAGNVIKAGRDTGPGFDGTVDERFD